MELRAGSPRATPGSGWCCPLLQTAKRQLNAMLGYDGWVEVPLLVPRCGRVQPMLASEVRSLHRGVDIGGGRSTVAVRRSDRVRGIVLYRSCGCVPVLASNSLGHKGSCNTAGAVVMAGFRSVSQMLDGVRRVSRWPRLGAGAIWRGLRDLLGLDTPRSARIVCTRLDLIGA